MFLGHLNDLANKFARKEFAPIFSYLADAIESGSEINSRITALKDGESAEFMLPFGIKAIEQAYFTKEPQNAFYESHKKMVDFQAVIFGREGFFVAPRGLCKEKMPYNPQKDLIEYESSAANFCSTLQLFCGLVAVFEKDDVHAGGIILGQKILVQKTVLKVPVELLEFRF